MNALITGGAGFIGSHLAETLLERDHTVAIIGDLSTGSLRNIERLIGRPGFSHTIDTVLNRPLMEKMIADADAIYHLAAAVGVKLIVESPIKTISTNIGTTELVLEIASRDKKWVLITSTSEVYGKLSTNTFSEDDDLVLGPTSRSRWSYAASKIIDEFLAMSYYKERGLPVVVARLFNTIGLRQTGRYGMVVPRFIQQAMLGEPITVYGDGKQRRSFTWVGDVVEALINLTNHPDAQGRVFNVGHTKDISIFELAVLIKSLTGSTSDIRLIPYEQAYESGFEDIRRRVPDISRIQRLFGYNPSLDLADMLEGIIEHERSKIQAIKEASKP